MRYYVTAVLCCFYAFAKAQTAPLNGSQVIEKAIAYHDPSNQWEHFNGEFTILLEMAEGESRKSIISLDLPNEYFNVTTEQDGKTSFMEVAKDQCKFTTEDGSVKISQVSEEECSRTKMYKDYYTYLYGLPMKLRDPGTQVQEKVELKRFKGKDYLVVRVLYDEEVGSDIWQFYFNPESYALEVYQFFKGTDETTGEYILLSDIADIYGIKMPKDRAWFYNKDDGYLGTDKLLAQ